MEGDEDEDDDDDDDEMRIRGYDEPKRAVYLGNAFNCIIKYLYYSVCPAKR